MTAAKLLFAGTPEFALESLQALHRAGLSPLAILTQPDRPAGRGKKLAASPVKQFACSAGIPLLQPQTLRDPDIVAQLAATEPDLMIVAAYGLLLPQAVLAIPRRGCVNVHASLLPRWRGAAPIQAAILHGDEQTGISLMQMEKGLDAGPVIARATLCIGAQETAGSLHDRLATLGGELLLKKVGEILDGTAAGIVQDDALATYAGKIRKQDAAIDWNLPATQIERTIRAYDPVPGASFRLDREIVRCWKAGTLAGQEGPPGTIIAAGKEGVVVACAEGALRILELQRPGRRRITAAEFAGQQKFVGKRLG